MKTYFFRLIVLVNITLRAVAESDTVTVFDGVTNEVAGPYVLGDTGPSNFLLITNGGRLANQDGVVGNQPAARGNVGLVTGAGSTWSSSRSLIVGATGALNQVSILAGGRAGVGQSAVLGIDALSTNNVLLIDGPGSTFDNVYLYLGVEGSGNRLVVTNGGLLNGNNSRDTADSIGYWETSTQNSLLVTGAGSTGRLDNFVIGMNGPRNHLRIAGGGRMINSSAALGVQSNSFENTAELTGTNSTWSVIHSSLSVGSRGPGNSLEIRDGARLDSLRGGLGSFATSTNNVVLLTGTGTLWSTPGEFNVGLAGSDNRMLVAAGASFQASTLNIGNQSSRNRLLLQGVSGVRVDGLKLGVSAEASDNELQLIGAGANWTNLSRVSVGDGGSNNRLRIWDGATFRLGAPGVTSFMLGSAPTSRGNEVSVWGAGSALLGNWALTVGFSGQSNRLTVLESGQMQSMSADIGQNCISRGNVAYLTDPGTVWSNGTLQVGFCSTNNYLVISNGARVFAGLVRSSVQGGASNGIIVVGADSLLRASGDLIIGNSGTGNYLSLTDGARAEGRNDRIGLSGGGYNIGLVSGRRTTWSNINLTIGGTAGRNRLNVADGGRVSSGAAMLGNDSSSAENAAIISGSGSAWNVSSNLVVGGVGHMNRLSVAGGASVSSRNLLLGAGSLVLPIALFNSDSNSVVVDGSESALDAAGYVVVGAYGRLNKLEIRGGAHVSSVRGVVGFASGSRSNSVLVTGPGSAWVQSGENLIIGSNGLYNTMTVSDGARVMNGDGYLGMSGADIYAGSLCFGALESFSRVTVTGPQSLWQSRGMLHVGFGAGGNRLDIEQGGTVRASGLLVGRLVYTGGACMTASNSVVLDGGCLVLSNESNDATLEIRHGWLHLKSGLVEADRLVATNDASHNLLFTGGTLRLKSGALDAPGAAFNPLFVGDGTHSATLVIRRGTLALGQGLIMEPNSTLSGDGTVRAAPLSVLGTLAPGDHGPGRLSLFGNQFALDDFSAVSLEIAGTEPGVTYDQVVTDEALFGGWLDIRLRGGFFPQPADVFEVVKFNVNVNDGTFGKSVTPEQRVFTVDRLGSFSLQRSGTNFVLTDFRSSDGDGDGIEDAWATNAFGHTPLTAAERAADADGDGASNADEFKAGTDPNDRSSVFRVAWVELPPRVLEWKRVRGKVYRVWYSEDLAEWHEVAEPTFAFSSDSCRWTDDGKGTGGVGVGTKFYRVGVE